MKDKRVSKANITSALIEFMANKDKLSKEIIELAQHVFDNLILLGSLYLQMIKSIPLA